MNGYAYYALVVAIGMLIITPLAWFALGTRRAAVLTYQPVTMAWDLPAFSDLDQERMRMYRLHPASGAQNATHEIRDDSGKRIGRVTLHRYEAPTIELYGCKFRVFDQTDRKNGSTWRGRVGGQAADSIVLQSEGKPVAEIFRSGGRWGRTFSTLRFDRGDVDIEMSGRRAQRSCEFRFDAKTVARVVRPDPTGLAPVAYVAMAARATPEFVAGVLFLATRRH